MGKWNLHLFDVLFSPLTKKCDLNPFDLHKRPLNGQICQAEGSRRLAVASLRRVTVGALHVVGQATSQKAPVFAESSQASVWWPTVFPLPISTQPKINPPSCCFFLLCVSQCETCVDWAVSIDQCNWDFITKRIDKKHQPNVNAMMSTFVLLFLYFVCVCATIKYKLIL